MERIAHGTVHRTPAYLRDFLGTKPKVLLVWQDITPLARNEWICWIESAKKEETRDRRIAIMQDKLLKGDRRPCCWAGCPHRTQ